MRRGKPSNSTTRWMPGIDSQPASWNGGGTESWKRSRQSSSGFPVSRPSATRYRLKRTSEYVRWVIALLESGRAAERTMLLALADDLPALWNHPAASVETRKRILRTVLKEIVVTAEAGQLHLVLHWQGRDHTRLEVMKNRSGQNRWKTDVATEQLVCELARLLPDHSIAPVLNRLGIRSAKGQTWTQLRVRNFRGAHQIPVYREGERAERHELILKEAASRLGVHKMTVIRLIQDGLLPARQVCAGAPYVIREDDLA